MAWPASLPPLESCGESLLPEVPLPELLLSELLPELLSVLAEPPLPELVESVLLESVPVLVVVAAWAAAMPTASVPAIPAATNTPVIAVVRRRAVSRSIGSPPSFVDDSTNVRQRPLSALWLP
ncbi:hypothetical protein [Actinoplanes sp. NPDC051494]|uniref:hypothetical protein n=1 Tax=Actinoplanes sp. NPDC051494 TaxID=3363907 RepID=UPI0037976FD1